MLKNSPCPDQENGLSHPLHATPMAPAGLTKWSKTDLAAIAPAAESVK
jgi:hypothetical protein